MSPEVIAILLSIWTTGGTVFFCVYTIEMGRHDPSVKQIIFISLLCGPMLWLGTIVYWILRPAYLLLNYIYKKLE